MGTESRFDSHHLFVLPDNFLGKLFRVVAMAAVVAVWVGMAKAPDCCAQTQPVGNPSQSPPPLRPSFGPVKQEPIPAAIQTTIGAAGTNANLPNSNRPASTFATDANQDGGQNFSLNPASQTEANNQPAQTQTSQPNKQDIQPGVTRVTKTLSTLPNAAGQIWREYDITPYTSKITTNKDPQYSITKWILRETGTEMWFHHPLGILNVEKTRILVYHTPEIQGVVKGIVDRFNRTRGQVQNIDVNLVTVENPNWRSKLYSMLQPIEVKSPGVEAWMISKENAAILLSQLRRRSDFKLHSGGRIAIQDGQSFVLEKKRPLQFVRNLRWAPNQIPNYQPLMTQVDEGYRLEISCLSAMDNATIEAVIKCDVDQVEKLTTVKVDVPGVGGGAQQINLQIPQLVSWRLHERFRWPNDQVLLLSCGVVATPDLVKRGQGLRIPGLPQKTNRADALLFFEYRGPAKGASIPQTANRLAPIRVRQ